MILLKDVLSELFKMFVGDVWLTIAILATVLASAALIGATDTPPIIGGLVLLAGSVAVLILSVRAAALRR